MPASSDLSDAPWELLARHLAGEVSAPERAALRSWVQADPQHLQLLTTVTRAWERAGEAAAAPALFSPADVEAAWLRLRPLLGPPPTAPPAARPPWWAARPVAWLTTAAVAGAGVLALLWSRPNPTPAPTTYVSATQPLLVRLPDSSRVWLNAHSQLRYQGPPASAASGPRAVQLAGEAYFEVAAHAGQLFVVSTAAARVRSQGSGAFNVRSYAAEDSVEVSVGRGAVWLLRPAQGDSLRLVAQSRATLRAADAPGHVASRLRLTSLAGQNFRAWHSDTLRFQDAPVTEVARTLQVTFGTRVSYRAASLGQCRFTGTFAHPRPDRVLTVLAAATASRVLPDGHGGYLLEGPGCASLPPAPPDSAATAARP